MMEMPRNSAVNVRSCSYDSTPHRKELGGETVMLAHSFKRQSPSRHGAEGTWSHDIHSHEVEDEQEVGVGYATSGPASVTLLPSNNATLSKCSTTFQKSVTN